MASATPNAPNGAAKLVVCVSPAAFVAVAPAVGSQPRPDRFLALAGYALDFAFQSTARSGDARNACTATRWRINSDFARDGSVVPPYDPPDPRLKRPGSGLYAQIALPARALGIDSPQGPRLPVGPMLKASEQVFRPLPVIRINGEQGQVYRYGYGVQRQRRRQPAIPPRSTSSRTPPRSAGSWLRSVPRCGSTRATPAVLLAADAGAALEPAPLRDVISELKRVRAAAPRHERGAPRELEPPDRASMPSSKASAEGLDRQRNTLADLAHSLKTPLAVLRSRLDSDTGESELREEVDTQLRRMNDMVSYQLARAARSGHQLFAAPIEIESRMRSRSSPARRGLCRPSACSARIRDRRASIFHGGHRRPAGVARQPAGRNAFKWAKSRVLLTVAGAEARRTGARLSITVEDDGPGIAEGHRPILQRGVRGDERVQGHGIGGHRAGHRQRAIAANCTCRSGNWAGASSRSCCRQGCKRFSRAAAVTNRLSSGRSPYTAAV